jgi:hypothetical protein
VGPGGRDADLDEALGFPWKIHHPVVARPALQLGCILSRPSVDEDTLRRAQHRGADLPGLRVELGLQLLQALQFFLR